MVFRQRLRRVITHEFYAIMRKRATLFLSDHGIHFLFPCLRSWFRRAGGRATKMLLLLNYAEVSSQSRSSSAALGASASIRRSDHRVPANLPAYAGHRREQTHTNPLLEDRRECRGQLLAKYRRQASVDCVAAAAGDQLGHRDQRFRFEGK